MKYKIEALTKINFPKTTRKEAANPVSAVKQLYKEVFEENSNCDFKVTNLKTGKVTFITNWNQSCVEYCNEYHKKKLEEYLKGR